MSGAGAVGVTVVAVVGGSAWLAARGVQAGALVAARSVDMLGAGLTKVGDRAQQSRAEWEISNAALQEWEAAARRVIDLNARIDVLRQHTPHDLAAEVPAPLAPCAQLPAELDIWCSATRTKITALEQVLRQRAATAVVSVLRSTVDLERPITATEAFDRYQQAMVADDAARRRATASQGQADVARILARLSPDVTDDDRAEVLAAAAQFPLHRPDIDHNTVLDELRLRVQRANELARTRRADAVAAATLLQAVPAGSNDPDRPSLRAELALVVAAKRTMDAELRARAERAAERVRADLERDYVRASVADTLAGLGYQVDQGFATVTGTADRMRLQRQDWAAHAVQVVVDGDEVRAAVIRLEDKVGADARREDVEREKQWCSDLDKLRTALAGSGMQLVERTLVPPGERVLPVAKSGGRPAASQEQAAREHTR